MSFGAKGNRSVLGNEKDLLIINKVDLAPFVGVDLEKMQSEAIDVRNGRPVIMTNCASGYGISEVMSQLQQDVLF